MWSTPCSKQCVVSLVCRRSCRIKVLNGFDKVIEGGVVLLVLKDPNVLSGDDVNDGMFSFSSKS